MCLSLYEESFRLFIQRIIRYHQERVLELDQRCEPLSVVRIAAIENDNARSPRISNSAKASIVSQIPPLCRHENPRRLSNGRSSHTKSTRRRQRRCTEPQTSSAASSTKRKSLSPRRSKRNNATATFDPRMTEKLREIQQRQQLEQLQRQQQEQHVYSHHDLLQQRHHHHHHHDYHQHNVRNSVGVHSNRVSSTPTDDNGSSDDNDDILDILYREHHDSKRYQYGANIYKGIHSSSSGSSDDTSSDDAANQFCRHHDSLTLLLETPQQLNDTETSPIQRTRKVLPPTWFDSTVSQPKTTFQRNRPILTAWDEEVSDISTPRKTSRVMATKPTSNFAMNSDETVSSLLSRKIIPSISPFYDTSSPLSMKKPIRRSFLNESSSSSNSSYGDEATASNQLDEIPSCCSPPLAHRMKPITKPPMLPNQHSPRLSPTQQQQHMKKTTIELIDEILATTSRIQLSFAQPTSTPSTSTTEE